MKKYNHGTINNGDLPELKMLFNAVLRNDLKPGT